MLNEIKFHGKPPKIVPLKYSTIDRESEKIKIDLKFILKLKNFNDSGEEDTDSTSHSFL